MYPNLIKKTILAIFFLVLNVWVVKGSETSAYPLGYCNGEITTNAIVKFDGANIEISGAIYIPSTYAATVEGNSLTAINVGIGSTKNVSDLNVWVRSELTGENLSTGGPADNIKQGWNVVDLISPVTITTDLVETGFYIGYSYMQSFKSAGLASLSLPSENGMWVKCGDETWENRSSEGTLCLEGLVYGESLPKYNVHVEGVALDKWYIIDKEILNGVISLRNLATETVNSIEIEAIIPGLSQPVSTTAACNISYNEIQKVPFSIVLGPLPDDPRQITGNFTITKINGNEDEDVTDNSCAATFSVIQSAYPRKVFLEEFTTESCSNCPRVAGFIHDMLSDPVYTSNVEAVCHHSGFGVDRFTIPADEQYTWFYNSTTTYAPAIMLDRDMVVYDYTPVFLPSSTEELEEMVDLRMEQPAVVSINIHAVLKDEDTVAVAVSGDVIDKEIFCENPRITVYLVEDNIETSYQAGAGLSFTHMHVTRQVNETWGAPLNFNSDNSYNYTCELPYKPDYKYEDMKVVAMIANYNSENVLDCKVENCGSISLAESAGVSGIESEELKKASIFSIEGIKLEKIDSKGLYIINGKKVLVK